MCCMRVLCVRVVCCVCVVSLCARNDSLIHLLCEYLRSMGKNGLWVHKKTRCSLRYQIRYAARILLQRGKKRIQNCNLQYIKVLKTENFDDWPVDWGKTRKL